jgi:hypothetical protein
MTSSGGNRTDSVRPAEENKKRMDKERRGGSDRVSTTKESQHER